jgi:hypothetical protein
MYFQKKPKFIHNLWTPYDDDPLHIQLRTSKGYFEVDKIDAALFLKIRSLCTGNRTQEEIAVLTKIPIAKVNEIIDSLASIGTIRQEEDIQLISDNDFRNKLLIACEMWGEQLAETNLFLEILSGNHPVNVFKGFLLETYHYIKDFPEILHCAAEKAIDSNLKEEIFNYYLQELGHESFIMLDLMKLGFSEKEVENSVPLVSTQTIIWLMKDLFERFPFTVFLVAKVIEADDFDENLGDEIRDSIQTNLQVDRSTLDGLIEHMKVDYSLGHSQLLEKNLQYIIFEEKEAIHFVINRIHDIKHAFDLQKLEIIQYYTQEGNYIPRQRVDYFGV